MIHAEVREVHIGLRYDYILNRKVDAYSRQLVDTATLAILTPDQIHAAFADLQITGVCVKIRSSKLPLISDEWPGYGVIGWINHDTRVVALVRADGQRRYFPLDVFRDTYELD